MFASPRPAPRFQKIRRDFIRKIFWVVVCVLRKKGRTVSSGHAVTVQRDDDCLAGMWNTRESAHDCAKRRVLAQQQDDFEFSCLKTRRDGGGVLLGTLQPVPVRVLVDADHDGTLGADFDSVRTYEFSSSFSPDDDGRHWARRCIRHDSVSKVSLQGVGTWTPPVVLQRRACQFAAICIFVHGAKVLR